MKHDQLREREHNVLHHLSKMPALMLSMHERENVSAMLLHQLCSKDCFDLAKAAFLVNNPDFHCLRGIAGFCSDEAYPSQKSIWAEPDKFTHHLSRASFNDKVRAIYNHDVKHSESTIVEGLHNIAENLHFTNANFASWQMPHDNCGIVMYEKSNPADDLIDKYLLDGLHLLSFCPLY